MGTAGRCPGVMLEGDVIARKRANGEGVAAASETEGVCDGCASCVSGTVDGDDDCCRRAVCSGGGDVQNRLGAVDGCRSGR